VLVVEDEPDARELLSLTLEVSGAKVVAVDRPRKRWTPCSSTRRMVAQRYRPADRKCYELICKVRSMDSEARHVPAVALTAFRGGEGSETARVPGFSDPFGQTGRA